MKNKLFIVTSISFLLFSCGNTEEKTAEKVKSTQEKLDKEADKMFEESMEELDQDVQEMDSNKKGDEKTVTETKTILKEKIENGKKMVEEKTIEIKKELK
jgi:hypothetical protein